MAGEAWAPAVGTPAKIAAVLRAVRAALRGGPPVAASGIDAEAMAIAVENRLAILVAHGLGAAAADLAAEPLEALERYRQLTIRLNTANLLTLRRVLPLLAGAGVPTLVFKGPVSQQSAYGGYFVKPSSDVDFLVADHDFDRARDLLDQGEHKLADECRSIWWRTFLGEQHMIADSPSRATIDLHHRVQQPGSVGPLHPERFLAERETTVVAGMQAPTLSPANAMLLSCMSLAKALAHREACGGHVADIAVRFQTSDGAASAALRETARRQGLTKTLELGLHAAEVLYGLGERALGPIFGVDDVTLAGMILTPEAEQIAWPKRRRMLWDLCDSKLRFGREAAWAGASELARVAAGT